VTAGVLWSLAAAVCFSLGQVFLARGVEPIGVARATTVLLVVAALGATATSLVLEGTAVLATASISAILWFVGAGLVHFGGWGLMAASIRRIGPARFASIAGVAPAFGALLAVVVLGETITLAVGAGIALVVAGTYLVATS
jgi:drug/metabolite transporter (DMT)-like permease